MKRKELLKEIITLNQTKTFGYLRTRETEIPTDTGKIISITGVRRCGKTHLIFDTIKKLRKAGINNQALLYINFEDERLQLKTDELDLIIQSYRELFPEADLEKTYFFFDEIQNVPNWEKFIRRLYDTISKKIFVTGSNSQMLSTDIASALRGRSINIELFPLSFREYLAFNNVDNNYYDPKNKAVIINSLKKFLISGSFPEILNSRFEQKILQDYFYVLLYKDLIERYKITNIVALKFFLNRIVLNTSKPTSINKIYNELKSAGHKISKDSLYQFAEYAEAVYFLFKLKKIDFSLIKQEQAEKKMYFIDNGLINSLSFRFSDNYGALLENAVFLFLRRIYADNLYFYKNKKECDFIVIEKKTVIKIIQVSYDISNKDTLKREIAGIEEAATNLNQKKGIIITFDQEAETYTTKAGIEIETIPAYKYFLSQY